ncbi:MAG: PAS domain-containing sensor histidine kinase [Candidatus Melainabacteria bacterium]|nr:PAS domain-containing sensor histidine kinase [Candidatus Melainabacteria bacterium]
MKNDVFSSTGVLLPLVVPAIIEVVLISIIFASLLGLKHTQDEVTATGASLVKFDSIYHSAASSALKVLTEEDETLVASLRPIRESLNHDITQLKNSSDIQSLGTETTKPFIAVLTDLSETIETVEGVKKNDQPVDQSILMGKANELLEEIKGPAEKLREKLNAKHKGLVEGNAAGQATLLALLVAALVTPALSAIYAFIFADNLSKRVTALHDSVIKISLGRGIENTLPGNDRFNVIHGDIQRLSVAMARSRQRERAMIDSAGEIICSLDESLKLSEVNPAIHSVLGYAEDELLGTNIQSLIHPDDRDMSYNELESIKSKAFSEKFEARLKHFDGEYLYTQWSVNWSAEDRSILCVIHDISDRKAAEKLKQDVIAMVSHDLRAPLTSIGVVLDMCMEGAAGTLNDRGKRLVSRAQISVSSLISMIKDLLDIERFEAGGLALNYENSNAEELIQRAVDMVKPEAERKKINLDISCDGVPFICDGERVNRILVNLINNAVKFSKENKTIYVTGKLLKHRSEPAEVEFQIIDEGPGIPTSKVDTLFDKFTQVGTGSEGERSGSGLGLAICKALVQAHRGKIGVKSTIGEGTNFWFRLPEAGPMESHAPPNIRTTQ